MTTSPGHPDRGSCHVRPRSSAARAPAIGAPKSTPAPAGGVLFGAPSARSVTPPAPVDPRTAVPNGPRTADDGPPAPVAPPTAPGPVRANVGADRAPVAPSTTAPRVGSAPVAPSTTAPSAAPTAPGPGPVRPSPEPRTRHDNGPSAERVCGDNERADNEISIPNPTTRRTLQ